MILSPPQWMKRRNRDELVLARWRLFQISEVFSSRPTLTAVRDILELTDEQVAELMRGEEWPREEEKE